LSQIPFSTLVTALAGMATSFFPEMPFPEQHVGHPMVARIDLAAVYTDGSGGSPRAAAALYVSIGLFLMLISASC